MRIAFVVVACGLYSAYSSRVRNYVTECSKELGGNAGGIELPCLNKCIHEKQGKMDSSGHYVISKYPANVQGVVIECEKESNATDSCAKANDFLNCFFLKTDPFHVQREQCRKKVYVPNMSEDKVEACFNRCLMITSLQISKEGKVNLTKFQEVFYRGITHDTVLRTCNDLVAEEDKECIRDVYLMNCINYFITSLSLESFRNGVSCIKETNTYPFSFKPKISKRNGSRLCYDRCIMIKTHQLKSKGEINKEYFKKVVSYHSNNITDAQIEAARKTCNEYDKKTDSCTREVYMFECVNFLLSKQEPQFYKICTKETNIPLVPYRTQTNDFITDTGSCNERCIMTKRGELSENGKVNRSHLKRKFSNNTIIENAIELCEKPTYITLTSCGNDINVYYCTDSIILMNIRTMCKNQTQNDAANSCYRRCMMINTRQLTLEGDVAIDAFVEYHVNVDIIKNAIITCKGRNNSKDRCIKDVEMYNCVVMEVRTK